MTEPTRENLFQWYITEKRSYRWMMSKIGRNNARYLKRLMIKNGIKIRGRSEAVATQWIGATERREQNSKLAKMLFAPYRGMEKSAETREKLRQSKLGSKNPMFGKFGPLNGCYLGGKKSTKAPDGPRKKAMERAGHKCEQCFSPDDLTIHHWPPYRECRSHDLKYLQVLCRKCHFNRPHHLK